MKDSCALSNHLIFRIKPIPKKYRQIRLVRLASMQLRIYLYCHKFDEEIGDSHRLYSVRWVVNDRFQLCVQIKLSYSFL